ncbi:hypothetical protein K435DRAFT_772951 [Dendrothele bispora CBS 962.96]|uniref:EGF-like domain-containing protein n=1 Tax=Dendrothele bispora (strain CBS 962.96) TaxID=1314807 RepID=A0A4S8MUN5_DENBC|nr:hypothetical protein K435DRAFT_772951 [Dendrothele bispora CBS 962.96]
MILLFAVTLPLFATAVAQSSVVCVPGECLQGFSNTTIGITVNASGAASDALLLPGEYTASTNPQFLHDLLTSSSVSFSPSAGFENSSSSDSLPLNVALDAGIAIYPESLYAGSAGFSALPSSPLVNASTAITASSFTLSQNVWVALDMGSNGRVVFWDSVPNVSQLPVSGSMSLVDIQSSACSPPCSGSGVCSASGTCTCPSGFTGQSCESCASGHFGPTCQACPSNCSSCDDGITGTGVCLSVNITNAPSTCNCLNGECGSNSQCSCKPGWTTADNGTACAKCASGFFLTTLGECSICQLGCTSCADGTGECLSCASGFTQDGNDKTKCEAVPSTTSDGTVCPDNSFGSGSSCQPCSSSCQTCNGGTSNDCIICKSGTYKLNGACVSADGNGVCAGSSLIADNNKHECDTCGPKCMSCKIPNFTTASTVNELQCTGCLPGSFLSNGSCVDNCPSGTFLSTDSNSCQPCGSSCGTCAGSANFCLSCTNNQLAFNGSCVSSCPGNSFKTESNTCDVCHPDCASCSGTSFNQCTTCPSNRPVLNSGRCLPVCSKSQFFDNTSGSCQSCDSSCSSCSGSGSSNCLACSSSSQVLRGGTCVSANCNGTSTVVQGLGVCLNELVSNTSTTSDGSPLPTIPGLSDPTKQNSGRKLAWWEILLMTLGCAFIFLVILLWWRRRARKRRAQKTKQFAVARGLDGRKGWVERLVRFGEKLFGHRRSSPKNVAYPPLASTKPYSKHSHPNDSNTRDLETERIELMKLRNAEEARHNREVEKMMLYGDYEYDRGDFDTRMDGPSMYSQVTGTPSRAQQVKQPVKMGTTTAGSSVYSGHSSAGKSGGSRSLLKQAVTNHHTGTSSSKNPFRAF